MGRASSQCLVAGLETAVSTQGPAGRRHRLLLVAGPWEVVVSLGRFTGCPEQLAAAAAGCVSSQGSDSNNMWCLVVVPSEVTGATTGTFSRTPGCGGRPCPSLVSAMTAVVCLCYLQNTQEVLCHT